MSEEIIVRDAADVPTVATLAATDTVLVVTAAGEVRRAPQLAVGDYADLQIGTAVRTTTGPVVGSFTRTLNARDRLWLSPRDLGADGLGIEDDTQRILDLLEVADDLGVPNIMFDGLFRVEGSLPITRPIRLFGRNQGHDRLHLDINPTMPGLYINASDVTVEGLEIRVATPDTIANGQGQNNTCITIGEWFNPAGLAKIERVTLRNLNLTRTDTSGSGHAMAIVGRVSGVSGENLSFLGDGKTSTTGRHGSAILAHWGGQQAGVRIAADSDYPLIQSRFEPGCYSHHPNNLRFRGLVCRNTSRVIQLSAVYSVTVDGFDYDGGVDGGQIIDLVAGDEGDWFAHPEDQGRVYTDISIRNGNARNLTGSGSNANSVIDITGFTTSKQLSRDLEAYASAPYTTEAYAGRVAPVYRMPTRWNVVFENITFDGGPRAELVDVTEYRGAISIRTFNGNLTFKNVRARGNEGNLALQMANATGTISFKDCELFGGVELDEVSQPRFINCLIKVPPYPVIQVTLSGTSASWVLGSTIVGTASGARGELIEKVQGSSNVVLVQMDDWRVFDTATPETLTANGANPQTISAQTTYRNLAALITGEAPVAYLAANVAKNDTTISVTVRLPFYALSGGSFGVGDTITGSLSGNTATVVAVVVGPATTGYPTTSTEGCLYVSGASGPFRQDDGLSNGLGVTARMTYGWAAVERTSASMIAGLPIVAKTADFTTGDTVTGALSGKTATVAGQSWTADRIELWITDASGLYTVGETLVGATSGASLQVVSRTLSRVIATRLSGWPANGETLTGSTSGATAELTQHLYQPGNGVLSITGGTGLFQDGELVTGSLGGSARVSTASAAELRAVPYDGTVVPFQVGEFVMGAWSGARGQVQIIDNSTLFLFSIRAPTDLVFVDNEPLAGDLGGSATANIPAGPIPASQRGGFPVALRVGDEITCPAGTFRVASYHRVREVTIAIEPAPFAATAGTTVTADHFSRGVGFFNTTFSGGYWGVEAEYCLVDVNDCVVEQTGIYGFVNDSGADVTMKRTRFRQNGLTKASAYASSANPRDVAVVGGSFTGRELRFESGPQVSHSFVSTAAADQVTLEDSKFAGNPSVANTSIVALTNSQPIRFNRNTTAAGVPVVHNNSWTPTLLLGGGKTGMTGTFTGTYQLLENLVFIEGRIVLTAKGSSTGLVTIGGLPIAPISGRQSAFAVNITNASGLTGAIYGRYSTSAFNIFQVDADGVANVTDANITDTSVLNFNGFFARG